MLFLLVFILSAPVSATDNIPHVLLTGNGENEIAPHGEGNVFAPSALIDGNKWKMWYGGQGKVGHDRISYAESTDGKQWNRLGVGLEDKTASHINDSSVIKVGSTFFMYFTRAEKFVIDRICVATSTDGTHWDQKGLALDAGPNDSWDSLSVGRPTVIHDDGFFKMWHDGRKYIPPGTPVAGAPVSSDSLGEVELVAALQALRDLVKPLYFVVRDYGILVTTEDKRSSQTVSAHDFEKLSEEELRDKLQQQRQEKANGS